MKNLKNPYHYGALLFVLLITVAAQAQNTGYINRPATATAGQAVLDPNGDGYTSATSSGFAGNDVANSELIYKAVPSFSIEPFGDLRRGPSHLYSDFVPDANGVGYYAYNDGTNLLFRMRIGSVMSGSKGYSIMLDTDGKFGAAGASADPNYQAATTGTNGNPGFEIEVVFETNFRIAIYNVDGTSIPVLVKSYTNWQDMSQVSIAGTFDNGDPDFFIDFYIPFSDLAAAPFNLTTSTPLRMSATTVMAPTAAIGGPKSDIYGVNDIGYKSTNDEYEALINAQPAFTATNITSGGTGFGSMCTAAPTVNSPIGTGTVSISGTWTKSSLSGAAGTTTITVYKNGSTVLGTVPNVDSGTTWTLSSVSVANGDIITAKAQSTGESMCLVSNSVTASNCNSLNRPATPVLGCYTTTKGITGSNLSTGWTVHVDNVTYNTPYNSVSNTTAATFGTTTTGTSPAITWTFSGGCATGSPLTEGSYKVYYTDNNNGGCASEPAFVCVTGNGSSKLGTNTAGIPSITSPSGPVITTATTTISGSAEAGSSVYLYVNGSAMPSVTATGTLGSGTGTYTFPNLKLLAGQQVYVTNEVNTGTASSSKCEAQTSTYTVLCFTTPPIISADNSNQIAAGLPITGTSGEPAGTTIKVYISGNTLIATTTVQSDGTWSTGNSGTTPAAYNAVASTTYYATAQNGTCGVSANSANASAVAPTSGSRCGSITGPVSTSATSVTGTLSSAVTSTVVNLYLDGILIGTTTTSATNWTINSSSFTYPLYANGTLTIGIQEPGKQEILCSASTGVDCGTPPTAPVVSPNSFSITQNESVTYNITNAVAGYFYGVADAATGQSFADGVWATSTGNLSITTIPFNSSGSYNIVIKATNLSGVTVCTSAPTSSSVAVNSTPLPVTFLNLSAAKNGNGLLLTWAVTNEQDVMHYEVEKSLDCRTFSLLAKVAYKPATAAVAVYSLQDNAINGQRICYRIKQVDKDGHYHYSSVIQVSTSAAAKTLVAPNPVTDNLSINMSSQVKEKATIQLLDINGRIVYETKTVLLPGANSIGLSGLQRFARGQYVLKLSRKTAAEYFKIVLQ